MKNKIAALIAVALVLGAVRSLPVKAVETLHRLWDIPFDISPNELEERLYSDHGITMWRVGIDPTLLQSGADQDITYFGRKDVVLIAEFNEVTDELWRDFRVSPSGMRISATFSSAYSPNENRREDTSFEDYSRERALCELNDLAEVLRTQYGTETSAFVFLDETAYSVSVPVEVDTDTMKSILAIQRASIVLVWDNVVLMMSSPYISAPPEQVSANCFISVSWAGSRPEWETEKGLSDLLEVNGID